MEGKSHALEPKKVFLDLQTLFELLFEPSYSVPQSTSCLCGHFPQHLLSIALVSRSKHVHIAQQAQETRTYSLTG